MRVAILAVAVVTGIIGTARADEASSAIRKMTHIEAQPLSNALRSLAKDRGIQVLVSSELLKDIKTRGADGELTTDEAFARLLGGTGLTYRYLDERTVTVVPEKVAAAIGRESAIASDVSMRVAETEIPSTHEPPMHELQAGVARGGEPIQEIIVTAQKRSERLQDVPVPVTVLDANSLADSGQVRLLDYYSMVPGLNVTPSYEGNQYLTIRGIATGGTQNPTVGVMIDDVPFTLSLGDGNGLPDLDPGDLAGIEVLRGPQGTLYGANSMGGLVKFVTKDPSFDAFAGRVEADTQSVHNGAEPGFGARGSVNLPISSSFAVRVSAFDRFDPGYIDSPLLKIKGIDEAHAAGGRLSALWRPAENLSLKLSAIYQNVDANGQQVVTQTPGLGDLQQSLIAGSGGSHRDTESFSAALKYRAGDAEFTSVTAYGINRFTDIFDTTFFGDGTLVDTDGAIQYDTFVDHKFTQELRLTLPMGKRLEWLLGAFYSHETNRALELEHGEDIATGQVGDLDGAFAFGSNYQEYAAFADATVHISDRFDVQLGGRYSRTKVDTVTEVDSGPYAQQYEGGSPAITPAASSTSRPFTFLATPRLRFSSDLMLYARVASGYRPGGPNSGCAAYNFPCSYNPDKTKNYEIGMKGDFFEHRLFIDASIYHIDWDDVQLKLDTQQGVGYSGNGGNAKSEGVELSWQAKPLHGLQLSGWLSYDDAKITHPPANAALYLSSGDRLAYSSRWSGNLSVQQDFPFGNDCIGFIGGLFTYVGDRLGIFTGQPMQPALRQEFPSYTKTDLRAGVRSGPWTANIYVNNVADTRGLVGGGPGYYPPNAFAYIQPRTLGLSLSKTW